MGINRFISVTLNEAFCADCINISSKDESSFLSLNNLCYLPDNKKMKNLFKIQFI